MKPQHWPVSKVLPCCPSRCKTACPPRKTLLEHGTVQWNLRRMARIGEGTEFWGKSRGKIGHERLKHKNFRDPRTDEILKPHVILVGGIPTPLKNMTSSIGTIIPNIWKIKYFQTTNQYCLLRTTDCQCGDKSPNNQPGLFFLLTCSTYVTEAKAMGMLYLVGQVNPGLMNTSWSLASRNYRSLKWVLVRFNSHQTVGQMVGVASSKITII